MTEIANDSFDNANSGTEPLWRIEMFGSLRLLPPGAGPGDAITHFPARKAGALLAYLAFHRPNHHGEGQARDILSDALWPDSDTEKARNNLRVTLNRLKNTLAEKGFNPDDLIVIGNHTIGLKWRHTVTDVTLFENELQAAAGATTLAARSRHLCEAADLYRGELLRDYEEGWIPAEARRLEGLFFDAARDLLSLLEEANEPERALRYAYHAASVDPLREEAHYDLLRLYVAQSQHDAARLHYERFSKALRKSFGRAPAPTTQALMASLLKPQAKTTTHSTSKPSPQIETQSILLNSARVLASEKNSLEKRAVEKHAVGPNGHTNGHLNGYTNGHANGHTNGHNGHGTSEKSAHSPKVTKARSSLWVGSSVTFLLLDNLHSPNNDGPLSGDEENEQSNCRARLRDIIGRYGGHEFGPLRSDSLWTIFRAASDALSCASAIRRQLRSHAQFNAYCGACRMALDTGDGGLWAIEDSQRPLYAGHTGVPVAAMQTGIKRAALDRALSVLQAGHPGQTLCSEVTGVLLRRDLEGDVALEDMGIYRLHNVSVPERIYQISYPNLAARVFPALLAPPLHSGDLPTSLTSFFGRQRELQEIATLLTPRRHTNASRSSTNHNRSGAPSAARIVTLTGFGGCGKTRLALEAARSLRDAYRRAVWFVPLSGVREPHLIIHAIVDTLRLPGAPALDPWLQVVNELGQCPSLLVLDNFEQLRDGGVDILKRLLMMAPSLSCLVTSRHSLDIEGEREVPVLPLPVPPLLAEQAGRPFSDAEHRRWRQQTNTSDSVRLFVDRARLARPTFELNPPYTDAVAQLCRLLEGVPLAIELVASHSQGLTPQQIVSLFGRSAQQNREQHAENREPSEDKDFDHLDYFHDDRLNTPSRQRSLRAVIQWSYELLDAELRQFFTRLWVFRGGWTPEAAQFVATADDDALNDAPLAGEEHLKLVTEARNLKPETNDPFTGEAFENLLRLQDHSLIAAEEQGEEIRFSMLSMLRSFAMEQLDATQCAALEARHAAYYIGLAERASFELMDAGRDVWLRHLDPEIDNLRAALAWSLCHAPAQCVQMAGALWRFWEARGLFAEGRDWLDRALSAAGTHGVADSLTDSVVKPQKTKDESAKKTTRPLAIAPNLPLPLPLYLRALNGAGRLAWYRADFSAARRLLGECLSLVRLQDAPNTPEYRRGVANALHSLGLVAMCQGDASAKAMLEEGLMLVRTDGDPRIIKDFMLGLALVKFYLADGGVRELLEESLDISHELNDRRGIAFALNNLGWVEGMEKNYIAARELHEASLPLLREMGDKWSTARALLGLTRVAWHQGDINAARAYSIENLMILRDLGSVWELVYVLEHFAWLALHDGKPQRAARFLGATDALREATGHVLFPIARPCYEDCVAQTRAALAQNGDDANIEALWRRGRLLSREEVILEALGK